MTSEYGQEAGQRSVMEISRLSSRENHVAYVRERILYSIRLLTFFQWMDLRSGVGELASFNNCTSKRVH